MSAIAEPPRIAPPLARPRLRAARTPAVLDPSNLPDRKGHELVDGIWRRKNMSNLSVRCASRITARLDTYAESRQSGRAMSEASFQFDESARTYRRPDAAYISYQRLPKGGIGHGHIRVAPEIAIEVISPGDSAQELDQKIDEYFRAGVLRVWIVNTLLKQIHVRRPDYRDNTLTAKDTLEDADVLPGFSVKVAELFAD